MRCKPRRWGGAVLSLLVVAVIALFLGPALRPLCALAAKGRQKAASAQALKQPGGDAQVAQAVDAALIQARKLLDAGKADQASRLLVQVRNGLGDERDPRVEGLLARAALALKRPEVALKLAEPFAENRDAYDPVLSDCYLAAGNAYLATDQPYKALLIFDWMAGQAKGLDLILAAEGCGRALLARKEFQKAAASFRFALRYARRGYDYPEEIQDLIRRLKAQLAKAERLADIDRYGEEFVRYRDAERLRRVHHNFAEARAVYAEIVKKWPETIYAEASRLYAAKCLVAMGKTDEAKRELHVFRQSDPYGLYRGEAAVEMGRIALEHDLAPTAARGAFLLAETWLHEVQNRQPLAIDRLAVPEKARKVTAPPRREKSVDFWGNVKKNAIEPGQLVNRHTCPWYLDDLKEQCAMYLGFLAFVGGKKDEALGQYKKILDCDPQTRRLDTSGVVNDYSRLKFGVDHGYLVAYPKELAVYQQKPRQRLAVLLMDFYHVTQRFEDSARLAQRMLKGDFGPLTPQAREYPQLIYAKSLYWRSGRGSAFHEYMRVVDMGRGQFLTFTQCRAAFCAGNVARNATEPAVRAAGHKLLGRLAATGKKNKYVCEARIRYAQNLIEMGRRQEGLRLLRTFPAWSENYKKEANYWLNWYVNGEGASIGRSKS